MSLPIAIVASGNGTNAQAMIDLMKAGVLDVDIRLVFCNRPGARVLKRAEDAGIPFKMLDHAAFPDRASFDRAMAEEIPDTTKLIIAQRISSVQHADRVIVMEDGEIHGFDTPANLLKTDNIYQEVYESQTGGNADFDEGGDL